MVSDGSVGFGSVESGRVVSLGWEVATVVFVPSVDLVVSIAVVLSVALVVSVAFEFSVPFSPSGAAVPPDESVTELEMWRGYPVRR